MIQSTDTVIPRLPQVDILIITALPVELEAILQYFDSPQKFQLKDRSTYYINSLETNEGRVYTLAVTMLNLTGNIEAAIHTTLAIEHLQPAYVFMVGIAGGMKDKVNLGDVVVSKEIVYYEGAKQTGHGIEARPQYISVNPLLLDRVQNYRDSDWHFLIKATRPKSSEPNDASVPRTYYGTFGSGEKVVADNEFVAWLKTLHGKLLAVETESFGVARATSYQFGKCDFLSIRGISDFADPQKNDGWHEYAASTAAAFTIGFFAPLRLLPSQKSLLPQMET